MNTDPSTVCGFFWSASVENGTDTARNLRDVILRAFFRVGTRQRVGGYTLDDKIRMLKAFRKTRSKNAIQLSIKQIQLGR